MKILELENDGLNMAADERFLYIRCKRTFYKYDLDGRCLTARNVVFKKDGKARGFSICDKYIFLTDYCDLYVLDKLTLETVKTMRIGENRSSDLGVVRFDERKAYINIRNGKMAVMDLETLTYETVCIDVSSSWDHCVVGERLYTGTVIGDLVETDAVSMEPLRKIKLCKKNIYSVVHSNDILYTVSQDTTIRAVDVKTFECIGVANKAVTGMARIIGFYKEWLVVADGRLSLWDKQTLELYKWFDFPTGHFNKGVILRDNVLIGSNYHGIYEKAL